MPDTNTSTDSDQNPQTPDSSGGVKLEQTELQLAIIDPGRETTEAAFRLTKTGIVIRDDLTEEEWKDGLKLFYWAQHSLKLGFSQYISFGKAKGYKVNDALAQLEFDMPTVKIALDLATVPIEMQHENLTAEHYLVLARADDLSKPKKMKWAKIASEQNLTPPQLKASIAAGEVVSTATARQQSHGIIGIHGISQEFDIWFRRVGELDGIMKMDKEHQDEILGEIEPIAKLYDQIKAGKPAKKTAKKAAKKKAK